MSKITTNETLKLCNTPLNYKAKNLHNCISYRYVVWCSQLNQSEFQDMDDETRVQYEGFRPGTYVRVEVSPKIDVLILLSVYHHMSCFVSAEKFGVSQNGNFLAMQDRGLHVRSYVFWKYLLHACEYQL